MALPLALSGLVTTKATVGPFKSSAGNYYIFGGASSPTTTLTALKASDPTSSFSSIATLTGFTTAVQQLSGFQVSDVIHLAICDGSSTSLNQKYVQYNMATDTFGTVETIVSAVNTENSSSVVEYGNSLAVRSTGEVVAFFNGAHSASIGGKHYARVYYSRRTGTNTWTAATEVDAGGATDYTQPSAGVDPSNNVDFIYANGGTELSSANVLTTWIGTQSTTNDGYYIVEYASGGNNEVGIYAGYSTNWIDAQSTGTAAAGNNPDSSATAPMRPFVDTAGPTCWVLYNKSNTLYVNSSTNNGVTWGTPSSIYSGTSISGDTALSVNGTIYQRGSNYVIPFVVSNNGTLYYDEYAVRTASTAWSDNANLTVVSQFGADSQKLLGAQVFSPAANLSAANNQVMAIGGGFGAGAALGSGPQQAAALLAPSASLTAAFTQLMADGASLVITSPAAPSDNIGILLPAETSLAANLTALQPIYIGLVEQAALGADLQKLLGAVALSDSATLGADIFKLLGATVLTASASIGANLQKLLGSDQLQVTATLGAQLSKLLGPALFAATSALGADLELVGSGLADNALLAVSADLIANPYLFEVAAADWSISALLNVNLINAIVLCCNYMTPEATFGGDSSLLLPSYLSDDATLTAGAALAADATKYWDNAYNRAYLIGSPYLLEVAATVFSASALLGADGTVRVPQQWSDEATLIVAASIGADATKYWDNAYNRAYLYAEPDLLMMAATGCSASAQLVADLEPLGYLYLVVGLAPVANLQATPYELLATSSELSALAELSADTFQYLSAKAALNVLSQLSAQALKLLGSVSLSAVADFEVVAAENLLVSAGLTGATGFSGGALKLLGDVQLAVVSDIAANFVKLLGIVELAPQTNFAANAGLAYPIESLFVGQAVTQGRPVLVNSAAASLTAELIVDVVPGRQIECTAGFTIDVEQVRPVLNQRLCARAGIAAGAEVYWPQGNLIQLDGSSLAAGSSLSALAGKLWGTVARLQASPAVSASPAQFEAVVAGIAAQGTVRADLLDIDFLLLETLDASAILTARLASAEQIVTLLDASAVLAATAVQLDFVLAEWSGSAMLRAALVSRRPDVSEFTADSELAGTAKLAAVAYAVLTGGIVLPPSQAQLSLGARAGMTAVPYLGANSTLNQSLASLGALSSELTGAENLVESARSGFANNCVAAGSAALDMGTNGVMVPACFMDARANIQRVIQFLSPAIVVSQNSNTIIAQQEVTSVTAQGNSVEIVSKGTIVITEE